MEYGRDRAWLDVDLAKVRANIRTIQASLTNGVKMMCVTKSDAYGLGSVPIAKAARSCGIMEFGAASIEEAAELRENGIEGDILVLGKIPDEKIPYAVKENITSAMSTPEDARRQGKIAVECGGTLSVEIAADCGMGRFGVVLDGGGMDQAVKDALSIAECSGIRVKGTFSHMTVMSEKKLREFDEHQIGLYREFTDRLREEGLAVRRHCCCSAMTILFPEEHMDMVRVGALPLGLQAPLYGTLALPETASLKTKIWHIKEVPMGSTVGYGPHYTKRRTKIAVIPIGFGDGLHRSLSDKAPVMIRGRRAKVFGKLCMDYTMVDVTDIPDVSVGDEVTLFGDSGWENPADPEISIFEYAAIYGGTSCEVTTSIGKRIPRFYLHEED
ncbi:MAG: alanine racemase [Eubacteriales bacterium]|nr:alanine racemase [Eubacteriales bacterium]